MKSILVIYYTQTGQLKKIADTICGGLSRNDLINIDFFRIQPVHDYPFPWTSDEFFDSMPESVKGIPVQIDMQGFPSEKHYDLVVLAYQVWYLSPSIPFYSFLQTDEARHFLNGKNVLTLLGVRNMWIVAQEKIKKILSDANANLVGNIVLTDKSVNMVSVITIIRWLMKGNKGPYRFFPDAGVSDKDIRDSLKFAEPVEMALLSDNFIELHGRLLGLKSVEISYHTMKIEKTAYRIFNIFAAFILRKGEAGSKKRLRRVRLFKYYLLFAIFVMFPVAAFVFNMRKILNPPGSEKEIFYHKGIHI